MALDLNDNALEIFLKCVGGVHASGANTMYNMELIYRKQGDNNQARILLQETVAVYAKVYGAEHSETNDALNQWNEDAFTCISLAVRHDDFNPLPSPRLLLLSK